MKPLNELSNTEKGRLLAELFPDERAKIVDAIQEEAKHIQLDKINFAKQWQSGMITANFWLTIVVSVDNNIQRLGYAMQHSSKIFSDQLFFGQAALFTVHCILVYSERKEADPKFKLAVQVLFGQEM